MAKRALSVDLRLPETPDFVSDPQLHVEMQRIYNALQNLAYFTDAASGRTPVNFADYPDRTIAQSFRLHLQDVQYAKASVLIPAGSPCYIRNVAGVYTAYLAKATYTAPPYTFATCFCVTNGGIAANEYGAFCYSGGVTPFLAGLADGTEYYLSDTVAGGVQNAPPVAAGSFVQSLGFTLDSTYFYQKIAAPVAYL